MTKNLPFNNDFSGEKLIAKYLIKEDTGVFRCTPKLQEIFLDLLPSITGSSNPTLLTKTFRSSLPKGLIMFFERQLFYVGNPGYIVLLDLPKECALENSFSAGLTSLVSVPVRYDGEGELVISIKPQKQAAANPSFANSKDFFLHIDLSYVPTPPDILTMVVKNPANDGGDTLLASVEDAHHLLSYETFHQLRLPQFHFSAPSHYKQECGINQAGVPIITYSDNGMRVRFRYDKVSAETKEGTEAIEVFAKMLEIKTQQIFLPKNSGIILNQRYQMHGRTNFTPTYDEFDRELTRSYGTICPNNYKKFDYETGKATF
jgi:Taurine catabolism dioxygenase TauD, TfdA family